MQTARPSGKARLNGKWSILLSAIPTMTAVLNCFWLSGKRIQMALLAASLGQHQVAQVDRVETPSKDSQSHE